MADTRTILVYEEKTHWSAISIDTLYWLDHCPQKNVSLKLWFFYNPQNLMFTNIDETQMFQMNEGW